VSQRRLARVLVDVAPLRLDRDYRWLWTGQAINGIGTQITRIALPYQVYVLTGSTLAVAALTAVQLIPILIFALGAGSVADAVDRRKLLLATQIGLLACSASLFALSLTASPPLIALFVVAFAAAGLSAVDQPARSSAVPRLVPAERLPSAIALNQLNFQVGSVVGPALGGLLIATVGLPGAYLVDVLSFSASIVGILAIAPLPPLTAVTRPGLAAIREGLRFVSVRRVILSTFVIDLNAMIFGMPTSLFPALALDVFKVGPAGLGLLAAAPAAGAFLGALLSGWVSSVRRVGWAVEVAVAIWGAAIALFGLSTFSATTLAFAFALLFLAIAGAADVLSAVFRSTIVQLETPDELRGRVTSIHILVVTSGPRLGDIEAATVAAVVGPQLSVLSGGLLCLAGVGVVGRLFPELGAHLSRGAPGPGSAGLAPEPAAQGGAGVENSKSKLRTPGS
jgi:MFS family permease